MFQTGFPPIMRSSKCTYSVRYLSDQYLTLCVYSANILAMHEHMNVKLLKL